jgi:AcrR family transcriptional regulator
MAKREAKARIKDARQALYREHILDAAERIFAERGYEDAKVVAMASAAGVSLATVYRAFPTKWDIYRAVHGRRTAALDALVNARVAAAEGLLERMLAGVTAYIEFHMENPNYLRMHLRDGHAWASKDNLLSPEQTAAWNAGLAATKRAFEVGIKAGIYEGEEAPELLARTMIAMHQVRLADWVERGMKESPDEVMRAVRRQFVRTFCKPQPHGSQKKRA